MFYCIVMFYCIRSISQIAAILHQTEDDEEDLDVAVFGKTVLHENAGFKLWKT